MNITTAFLVGIARAIILNIWGLDRTAVTGDSVHTGTVTITAISGPGNTAAGLAFALHDGEFTDEIVVIGLPGSCIDSRNMSSGRKLRPYAHDQLLTLALHVSQAAPDEIPSSFRWSSDMHTPATAMGKSLPTAGT